ncbi:hypothetical protein GHT06_021616 [Daphnia sinensis]|uniref:Uncharacterized protein n=1 Tax=Daphnia sinensis TaxID=1820382 RepID=A0AAD5L323_9CRUS|nr:hypothetical protein GHT06_003104 [Daphnia sinensis]KAI9553688.1 hypothetical protein GHT06_021616 [Daphnia sinensis]
MKPTHTLNPASGWDANWTTWNISVKETISSREFYSTANPELKYLIFHEALNATTKPSNIFLAKSSRKIHAEPASPWWNEDCRKAAAIAKKARRVIDPNRGRIICTSNISTWKEKENFKNRTS